MPTSLPTLYTHTRRPRRRAHCHALFAAGERWRWRAMAWSAGQRHAVDEEARIHHLCCPADYLSPSGAHAGLASSTALVYINVHIDTIGFMHTTFKINKLEHVCC